AQLFVNLAHGISLQKIQRLHCAPGRPQLCNNVTLLTFLTSAPALALPLQTTLAPGPDEAFDQEQEKNQNRDKCSDWQAGEADGKRHQKHRFNVEDQKDDGIQIILHMELDMRLADRFDSAFIRRSLVRAGFWWLEKSPP